MREQKSAFILTVPRLWLSGWRIVPTTSPNLVISANIYHLLRGGWALLIFLTLLHHLLPFLLRIPSHGPLWTLRDPFILQELRRSRAIPRVELYDLEYKGLIRITNIPFADTGEWFHLLWWHHRHDTKNRFLCLLIGDLLVRYRE